MERDSRLPNIFYIYYFAAFMGTSIYNSFFSTFFTMNGMSSGDLGLLFGISPLVGIIMQPVWGGLSDRAKYKNNVHLTVLGGVMFSIVLFYCVSRFWPANGKLLVLSAVMILFSAFNNALMPLQDTITLDYIDRNERGFYGYARMSGTLGYAFMALVAGVILTRLPNSVFPLYFGILCLIFFLATRLPKAQGYRKKGEKGSVFEVMKDKEVLLVLLLTCWQYTALAYGHTFVGPYMLSLGGNATLIGLANTVQALTEIPFHIRWGQKLMRKVGIHKMLIFSALCGALRWAITAACRSPWVLILATGLEGVMLVPLIVGVVEFINSRVPGRLKATGQTALTIFSVVIARTVGNIGGGRLVDLFDALGMNGMSMTYWVLVPVSLIAAAGFGIPLLLMDKARKNARTE